MSTLVGHHVAIFYDPVSEHVYWDVVRHPDACTSPCPAVASCTRGELAYVQGLYRTITSPGGESNLFERIRALTPDEISRLRSQPRDEAQPPPGGDDARARRWAIWHHQFDLIRQDDGLVYLTRWWLLKTPIGGIILHRMRAPDARETIHDHPFRFAGLVVRGRGYTERRLRPRTMEIEEGHRVRRWIRKSWSSAHAISELHSPEVWTLLLVGGHRRAWGFLEPMDDDGYRWIWTKADVYEHGHVAIP